jgi:ABC-type Mn2+/Zn2+ transport system ATPase subunit
VLVTHNLEAVRRLADRVVYLDQRVRAEGPPATVLAPGGPFDHASRHDHPESASVLCEED